MPVASIRGVNIFYQMFGTHGAWVALITGAAATLMSLCRLRRGLMKQVTESCFMTAATGRSDVLIDFDIAEEILWLDDLHELLKGLNALPAFIGGGSAGARTAMRFCLRFPADVRELL